jgi:carbon monoxide dehydrogenase subunit G
MKVEGSYKVPGSRETVYKLLLNREALLNAFPGCQKLTSNQECSYDAEMCVGIAAVKGMRVNLHGKGGFLKGEGEIVLSSSGDETTVSYSGETQVGGMIAAVGQRMIQAASRQIVSQFFQAFADQIQRASRV